MPKTIEERLKPCEREMDLLKNRTRGTEPHPSGAITMLNAMAKNYRRAALIAALAWILASAARAAKAAPTFAAAALLPP